MPNTLDHTYFTFAFAGAPVSPSRFAFTLWLELQEHLLRALDITFTILIPTVTNISYTIDDVDLASFTRNLVIGRSNIYTYNQSLSKVDGLTNAQHLLKVS
jgi:hypothetical protein